MDTLLRETVNAVVNSRFPEMSIEGRRQIESILIREEFPKGAIALNEGEVAHEIVFVGKGMLRQYYYKNGKDVTEHFSYPANRGNPRTFHYLPVPSRHDTKIGKRELGNQYVLPKDTGILLDCVTD